MLKLATRGSARLLGRAELGQIAPGSAADAFAIRYDRAELACAERDEANLFGTVGYHRPADYVWVNGRSSSTTGKKSRWTRKSLPTKRTRKFRVCSNAHSAGVKRKGGKGACPNRK